MNSGFTMSSVFRKDYIPLWLTLFLSLGILSGRFFTTAGNVLIAIILFLFLLLFFIHLYAGKRLIPPLGFALVTFVVFFLFGVFSIKMYLDPSVKDHYSLYQKRENKIILKIYQILKPSKNHQLFYAKILKINGHLVQGKVLLRVKKDSITETPDVGSVFYTFTPLKEISPAVNPYQFDYKKYLKGRHIDHQIILSRKELLFLEDRIKSPKEIAYRIRKRIQTALKENNFTNDEYGVINALLLGQRQEISRETYQNYKNAGAVHILAISGLHIGIILLILNFLLKPLEFFKYGKIIKLVLIIIILWLFAFLAGFSASVIRAVSMFSAIAIGISFKKNFGVEKALIISVFFLLLFHPFYIFDVGFQLSYLAVFFIVKLQPEIAKIYTPKNSVIRYFWLLFTVTLAAQAGVFPLSLYYFHQFPALFFVSALVIIPLLGIILGFGILIIIMASLNSLPLFFAEVYAKLIGLMNAFIAFIAHQERFIFQRIQISFFLLAVLYLFLVSLIMMLQKRNFTRLAMVLGSLILIQLALFQHKYQKQHLHEFVIFDQFKSTLITHKKGDSLQIYSDQSPESKSITYALNDYLTETGNIQISGISQVQNVYGIGEKALLVIDSSAVYIRKKDLFTWVLIRNSPKINLERVIRELQPEMIIADNSNYRSFIDRWGKTAQKYCIQFHTTSCGAFRYRY